MDRREEKKSLLCFYVKLISWTEKAKSKLELLKICLKDLETSFLWFYI